MKELKPTTVKQLATPVVREYSGDIKTMPVPTEVRPLPVGSDAMRDSNGADTFPDNGSQAATVLTEAKLARNLARRP